MRVPGKVWKWLGVAGVAGVAATGVVVARDQRRRAHVTPDQVRKRLRQRLVDAERGDTGAETGTDMGSETGTAAAAPGLPTRRRRHRR